MRYGNGRQFRWGGSGTQAYLLIGLFLIILGLIFVVGAGIIKAIIVTFGYVLIALGILALALAIINWMSSFRR